MQAAHPYMIDKAGEPMVVAADHLLPPELGLDDRLVSLAGMAALEACIPLKRQNWNRTALPCWLALPARRPGFDPAGATAIATRLAACVAEHGMTLGEVRTVPVGHAGGPLALRAAATAILEERCQVALVVGADSYLCADTLEWLDFYRPVAFV